jgi:IclR family pca regulon transcriptional regulator
VLARIRKDGYHVGQSTITPDLRLLAVPVLGLDGCATGALSVVAPTIHSSDDDLTTRVLPPLQAAARDIARAQAASGSTKP